MNVDECNQYGVYINRTSVVSRKILDKFSKVVSWGDLTINDLGNITGRLNLDSELTSLKPHDFQGLVNLTELRMSHNPGLKEIPQGLTQYLSSTFKILLTHNNFTKLPDDIFDGIPLRILEMYNTPVTLSENTFKTLLARDYLIFYYAVPSSTEFVKVTLGNETVGLENFVNLFKNGVSDRDWIRLSSPRLRDSGTNLTPLNRRFVCIYLQDELRDEGYLPEGSGMESIEDCENSDYFQPSPIPTPTPTPTPSTEPTSDTSTEPDFHTITPFSSAVSHRGLIGDALHIIKGAVSYLS